MKKPINFLLRTTMSDLIVSRLRTVPVWIFVSPFICSQMLLRLLLLVITEQNWHTLALLLVYGKRQVNNVINARRNIKSQTRNISIKFLYICVCVYLCIVYGCQYHQNHLRICICIQWIDLHQHKRYIRTEIRATRTASSFSCENWIGKGTQTQTFLQMWSHTIAIVVGVYGVYVLHAQKFFEHKNIATYTATWQRRLLLYIRPSNTNEMNMTTTKKSNCDKNVASGMAFETIVVHSVSLCRCLVGIPFFFFSPNCITLYRSAATCIWYNAVLWWMIFTHSHKQSTQTHTNKYIHNELASSKFSNKIHTKVLMCE